MFAEIEELLYFLGFKKYTSITYRCDIEGVTYQFLISGELHFYYLLDVIKKDNLCINCFSGFCEYETLLQSKNKLETYFKSYIRKKKLQKLL